MPKKNQSYACKGMLNASNIYVFLHAVASLIYSIGDISAHLSQFKFCFVVLFPQVRSFRPRVQRLPKFLRVWEICRQPARGVGRRKTAQIGERRRNVRAGAGLYEMGAPSIQG